MAIVVNGLMLQDLFYRIIDDLEIAQNQVYNDDIDKNMRVYCNKQRAEYIKSFKRIIEQSNS